VLKCTDGHACEFPQCAFHQGEDSAFVYDWINDEHGGSWLDWDVKETEWLMDQSYQDTSEESIE
jgi:hypothetical protein